MKYSTVLCTVTVPGGFFRLTLHIFMNVQYSTVRLFLKYSIVYRNYALHKRQIFHFDKMVWIYTSTALVDRKAAGLWQLWRVWSTVPLMPKWDKDCHSARLDSTLETGNLLFIAMTNKPEIENKCVITRVAQPDIFKVGYTGLHFTYAVPLAELTFKYEAEMLEGTDQIRISHSTEIAGLLSGMYGFALKNMIKDGCNHMSECVPELASLQSNEPDRDI